MKPLKIYVAGPYSADTEVGRLDNVQKAFDIALELMKKGHYPYIPHASHFIDLYAQEKGMNLSWDYWIKFDDAWVTSCDALFYISSSRGADIELDRAIELGLEIFNDLSEVLSLEEMIDAE